MTQIPLLGAPYQGRSVIASGQRAVNVYAETNSSQVASYQNSLDPQAPTAITYYPTPGTVFYAQDPANQRTVRGEYRTSQGVAYVVIGSAVYFLNSAKQLVQVGIIADRPSQVYFADNGIVVVLVDGANGYVIDIQTNAFAQIIDPAFYGADFVVFLDTFFVFNRPGTNQFYISLSQADFGMMTDSGILDTHIVSGGTGYVSAVYSGVPLKQITAGQPGAGATADITVVGGIVTAVDIATPGVGYVVGENLTADNAFLGNSGTGLNISIASLNTAFDPLDIAAKSGSADPITSILAIHRELWLVGELTTEVWIGTGAADFFFQEIQGAYIDHGCAAPYSAAFQDVVGMWLMQDRQGQSIVVQTSGYGVTEISTPRIVEEFSSYPTIADAIGFCFQISDHAFYCLTFPTANKTWLFELKTGRWCEWATSDVDGNFNRHRANCCMFVYGQLIVGDFENGSLYTLEEDVYTDNGLPIIRIRTFPHIVGNFARITYNMFIADIQPGTYDDQNAEPPMIDLSWSDDRGVTFGNPIAQPMGSLGNFLCSPKWSRLGMARDRIFKLQWSAPMKTALNGAFIDFKPAKS